MAIPQNHGRWVPWVAALCLIASSSQAQVFVYRHGAENFEAVVSDSQLTVRERYQGVTTVYGDLSCPLGSAVKASRIADSKLCLAFSKETCRYSRYQNGTPVHNDELANARVPRMCIVLANDQEARRLARLVNAGAHPAPEPPVAMGATGATTDRTHSTLAGPDMAQVVREQRPTAIVTSQPAAPDPEKAEPREADVRTPQQAKVRASKAVASPQKEARAVVQKSPPGKWATGSFNVGLSGNAWLRERTYLQARIVNKDGAGRRPGGFLQLRNTSGKYALYYGLHKRARYKLEAGEQVVIPLGPAPSTRRPRVTQIVTIRWLQDGDIHPSALVKRTDGRGRKQEKAAVKGAPPTRPPTSVPGRTLTVQPGDTPQGTRKWVAVIAE